MSVSTRSWPAVETAKAFLRGEVDLHALAQAGEQARSGVAGASMIGLPRCIPHAAAQIAAYSTTFEPLDAAMEAVSWAVKAATWREVERIMETAPDAAPKDHFPRIREYLLAHPQLDAQCDTQVRPRYADACRLFLGNPFAGTPGAITYSDIATLLESLRDDPPESATTAKPAPIPQALLARLWSLVDKTLPS